MKNDESKKKHEWQVLREYCFCTGQDPDDFLASETPDFRHRDGSVVLEFVEYFRDDGKNGSPRRKKQELLDAILRLGKLQFGSLARCNVLAGPSHRIPSHGLNKDNITCELVSLVQQYKDAEILLEAMVLPASLRDIFSWIEIYPTPAHEAESLWQVVEAGVVDVICTAVKSRIEAKNKLVAAYRKNVSPGARVQLLIYASLWAYVGDHTSTGTPAGYGRITDELQQSAFNMEFDDVFFMDRQERRVIALRKAGEGKGVWEQEIFEKVRTALHSKLGEVATLLHTLEDLYTDTQVVARMNEYASAFFGQHQALLVDTLFLEIAKLFDPAQQGKNSNLSLPHLVKVSPFAHANEQVVKAQLELAKGALGRIPQLRNKFLAHNDLAHSGQAISESLATMKDALALAKALFQLCCGSENHHHIKGDYRPAKSLTNFLNRTSLADQQGQAA
jgi:hypothetical protein